jgi:hypothetical protein
MTLTVRIITRTKTTRKDNGGEHMKRMQNHKAWKCAYFEPQVAGGKRKSIGMKWWWLIERR